MEEAKERVWESGDKEGAKEGQSLKEKMSGECPVYMP